MIKLNRGISFFLLLLLFVTNGYSQWNANSALNTPVCLSANDQYNTDMISDGRGGGIIAWVDARAGALVSDIYVQRINSLGIVQWTVNGLGVCTWDSSQTAVSLTSDNQGGVFLAWNDARNGSRDVYAQAIDSSGNLRWAANGIAVCNKPFDQRAPKLIADGSGGVIICWEDSTSLSDWDIYAQKITSAGAIAWASGGVAVSASANAQADPRITSDGAGGAIIVWQDKRNGADNDVYVQRLNGAGLPQWTTNGVFVVSAPYSQKNPKIKSDNAGGAIMVWQDGRVNGSDSSGIFAQRVNGSGQMQWATNGIAICASAGGQSQLDLTNEGLSGVVVTWRDKRNGVDADIYAQKIDTSGALGWTVDGIPVSSSAGNQSNPSICGDGSGGVILCWEDQRNGTSDIFSQRILPNGNPAWQANGLPVGTAANDQLAPQIISDGSGGAIFTWEDFRSGTQYDIYAHHLYADGNPFLSQEGNADFRPAAIFPNPANAQAILALDEQMMREGPFTLSIFNGVGILIREFQITDSRTELGLEDLPAGVYTYLISGNSLPGQTGKFVLIHGR